MQTRLEEKRFLLIFRKTFPMRLFIFLAGLLVFLSVRIASAVDHGLVACYPFSGTANDLSGHDHHGNVFGATLTADRFGVPGCAFEFNGTTDFINLGRMSDITLSNEFSLSVWIRPNQVKLQTILFLMPDNLNDRLNSMAYYDHNGNASTIWDFGDCYAGGRLMQPGASFSNTWQHWVFTIHPANGMKVFVNGVPTHSHSTSSFLNDRNRKLWIGGGEDASGAQFFFDGAIDDLRLYDRTLSITEVTQLHQMESLCSTLMYAELQQQIQFYYDAFNHTISFPVGFITGNANMTLFNLLGQQVHRQFLRKGTTDAKLPDEDWLEGMMILIVELGGGQKIHTTRLPLFPR